MKENKINKDKNYRVVTGVKEYQFALTRKQIDEIAFARLAGVATQLDNIIKELQIIRKAI